MTVRRLAVALLLLGVMLGAFIAWLLAARSMGLKFE